MNEDYTADERVNAWIVAQFRANEGRTDLWALNVDAHLRACPDTHVESSEGSDGVYGCDTGCEYARLEAVLGCEHGMRVEYEYGSFGELADILAEIP